MVQYGCTTNFLDNSDRLLREPIRALRFFISSIIFLLLPSDPTDFSPFLSALTSWQLLNYSSPLTIAYPTSWFSRHNETYSKYHLKVLLDTPCRNTCPLLAAFQTLAQREANARIRSEYQRLVQIREEKEELQRQQINKRLEEKVALQWVQHSFSL